MVPSTEHGLQEETSCKTATVYTLHVDILNYLAVSPSFCLSTLHARKVHHINLVSSDDPREQAKTTVKHPALLYSIYVAVGLECAACLPFIATHPGVIR